MNGVSQTDAAILHSLAMLEDRLTQLSSQIEQLSTKIEERQTKDWYSTAEVAELMGVTQHTVRERWCNQGRIICEKEQASGKWRIPGHEYERLRQGGRPRRCDFS